MGLFAHCAYIGAKASDALPVKEVILGVSRTHKKELQKHSLHQPHTTFLGMPIKKWLYQWGESHFHAEKIKNDIANINKIYAHRIAKATTEKEKLRLTMKQNKLIARKEHAYSHGNGLMRIGERPVYYDPMHVAYNEKTFLNYLQFKGYLDATITSRTVMQKKRVHITYCITPNRLYKIAAIKWQIADKAIHSMIAKQLRGAFIKEGQSYQYQDLVNEQERIIGILSNNGYFEFDEKYVHFTVEVSPPDATIAITAIIDNPPSKTKHDRTKIERVTVDLTTPSKGSQHAPVYKRQYQGIDFLLSSRKYPLAQLVNKIALQPGHFYAKNKILETYERLHALDLFRSITILPKEEAGQLTMHIYARPYERVLLQTELGAQCVNLQMKTLRPAIKLMPVIRRVGNGLGILHLAATVDSMDPLATKSKEDHFYNHMTYGIHCKFITPSLVVPFLYNKQLLASFHPNTRFEVKYSLTRSTAEQYLNKMDVSLFDYTWYNKNKRMSYQFSPLRIYTYPYAAQEDDQDKHERQHATLAHVKFLVRLHNSVMPTAYLSTLDQYIWIVSVELEGGGPYGHLFFIQKMLPKQWPFYQYIKLDVMYRHAFHVATTTMLVYQTKFGIIKAYGNDKNYPQHKLIPIDKQYEIGGYGKVRAWDAQSLGPGRHTPDQQNKTTQQRGDLFLLGNIELRQKLIGHLEGALFLDAGNTWQLTKHAPSTMQFDPSNFYQAFAIGGGIGLRLNFYDIFVICGDIAIQLHRPYREQHGRTGRMSFNLNVGYPF